MRYSVRRNDTSFSKPDVDLLNYRLAKNYLPFSLHPSAPYSGNSPCSFPSVLLDSHPTNSHNPSSGMQKDWGVVQVKWGEDCLTSKEHLFCGSHSQNEQQSIQ